MNYQLIINIKPNGLIDIQSYGVIENARSGKIESYTDGWFNEEISHQDKKNGVYNVIKVNRESCELEIFNDPLGQKPLYFSIDDEFWIASDSIWGVVKGRLDLGLPIIPDEGAFIKMRYFKFILPFRQTIVEGIYRLPPGVVFNYSHKTRDFNFKKNNLLLQNPDRSISIEVAAKQMHERLDQCFSYISEQKKDVDIWFGNSGGLDSRLIPAYANRHGIDVSGFLIHNQRFIKNYSEIGAENIGKLYGIPVKKISYDETSGSSRLMRDIIVSPHGTADFHKNAAVDVLDGALILCGGNSFIITNDSGYWRQVESSSDRLSFFIDKFLVRNEVPAALYQEYKELLAEELEGQDGDWFDMSRGFHYRVLNSQSPMGAYESMSYSGDFQYIYHPWLTDISTKWPRSYFFDRTLQKVHLTTYFPELSGIADQVGISLLNNNMSVIDYLIYRLRLKVRGDGLDYGRWIKSDWYKDVVQDVEKVLGKNDDLISKGFYSESFLHSNFEDRMSFLKLSRIYSMLRTESSKLNEEIERFMRF